MTFKDGAEDYWERQRITERLAQVTLPPGITPSLDPVSGPAGEIYRYTLESDTKNLMQLSELQNWTIVPALQQVPGVANVDVFGGFTKEFQLELDPAQLLRYKVSVNQVSTAISANTANAGGGRITRGEQSYIVRGIGMVHTLKDLGDIVVTQTNGVPVFVRDLGKLQYGHQVREGILGKDSNPDTIEGIVDLLKYENPSRVLEGIHAKVAELNQRLAVQDVRIVPYIDRDDLVKATKEKVLHTVMEGVGLVCMVLILFLGNVRAALVARRGDSDVAGDRVHPDALPEDAGESVFAGRNRFRRDRRWHHRGHRGDFAPTRGEAGRSLDRGRRDDGDLACRPLDLLRHADHHHGVRTVARVRARRRQAVCADGLHRRIRAAGGVAVHDHADARAGLYRAAQAAQAVPQQAAGAPAARLQPRTRQAA